MITKEDCMSILVRLEDNGIDINKQMLKLATAREVPIDTLKFIAEHQGIEVINFYEMLRKNHNKKKSPLYVNLLKEQTDVDEILTVLSCLLTQIVLYSKKLTDTKQAFLKEVRAEEITKVLNSYYRTNDFTVCANLLKLIRTDILVLDYINGRRELA